MTDSKVSVTALKYHTTNGKAYNAGDTYEVPEGEVENLVAQGMARPTNEAKHDAKAASIAPPPATPPAPRLK